MLPPGVSLAARIAADRDHAPAVAWSCDGRRLAILGRAGGEIWSADATRRFTFEPLPVRGSRLVAWSPTDPGLLLHARGPVLTAARVNENGDATPMWTGDYPGAGGRMPAAAFRPSGEAVAVIYGSILAILRAEDGGVLEQRQLGTWAQGGQGLCWSPVGDLIYCFGASFGAMIVPFDVRRESIHLGDRSGRVRAAAWSPDGRLLATVMADRSIHLREASGMLRTVLEGQDADLTAVAFSHDGRLLYAASGESRLWVWDVASWQSVAVVDLHGDPSASTTSLAAAPHTHLVAWPTRDGVDLLAVDPSPLLGATTETRTYVNAKVVLLGESGVGKSGLGLVLTGQTYRPTDSTHARQVFTFDAQDAGDERRETLLWDMAGQPGYRLIHQLHLAEAAVAVVVFDARAEADPFAGVRYWTRALRQQTDAPAILVAARVDRGGIPASRERIDAMCAELGLLAYFETSAREGWQIAELAAAIRKAIDWDALPRSVSTEQFETIKRFLVTERDQRMLATADDLHRSLPPELSRDSFDTCVRLLESRDLLRRLSFGGFVLLRPELLDAYASALIDAARGQPDGLGYLAEEDALAGRFPMPAGVRLQGPEERLLLIATVEELLRHDLVLREVADGAIDLVFPSQFTVRREAPADATADVVLRFEGSVPTVYAVLAVRLSHVAAYRRDSMWRDASTYRAKVGGLCGIRVRETEEGRGELTVFFDAAASEETRFTFEEYVHAHVTAHARPGSVFRERVFTCPGCAYRIDAEIVRRRLELGASEMTCPVCERERILLLDREDRLGPAARRSVHEMNASADAGRDAAANTATIRGKETTRDFDVFISYNTAERPAVAGIAEGLRSEGLLPWFDTRDLEAGREWQDELARQIRSMRAAAIFIGPAGVGSWQKLEIDTIVDERTRRPDLRVIPVLLPGTLAGIEQPLFLKRFQAVDFRVAWPSPFARLVGAIDDKEP